MFLRNVVLEMFLRVFVFVMLCCDWEVVTMQLFNFTINLLIVGGVMLFTSSNI